MELHIWIIDDESSEIDRATEVIRQIESETGDTIYIESSKSFHWPLVPNTRPDLLILDIANHTNLDGIRIYRSIELERTQLTESKLTKFVIVWSAITGEETALKFFDEKIQQDDKLILCTVKSKLHLADVIRGCIDRLKEEF